MVAVITFLLYVLYKNPGLLGDIWLWLVGLAGLIVKGGQATIKYIGSIFDSQKTAAAEKDTGKTGSEEMPQTHEKSGIIGKQGTRMVLQRYRDDGNVTLGLLYVNEHFYCYTIEDSAASLSEGKPGKIPPGSYAVGFEKAATALTTMYRARFPEWFTRHIQLSGNSHSAYLYNGSDSRNNHGNIMVSDFPAVQGDNPLAVNPIVTYERLYKYLAEKIYSNIEIVITISEGIPEQPMT